MKKIYIASGWFNAEQEKDLKNIKNLLTTLKLPFFSPKDECTVKPKDTDKIQNKVFKSNIEAIKKAEFIIANTRDKDMGTIFECGIAFANKIPIIYYCGGLVGGFNLMLAQSGIGVAVNIKNLELHIRNFMANSNYISKYRGNIE